MRKGGFKIWPILKGIKFYFHRAEDLYNEVKLKPVSILVYKLSVERIDFNFKTCNNL